MIDKLISFKYLLGAGAVVLALVVTVFVQHTRIEAKNARLETLTTKLETSANSINRLTAEMKRINNELRQKAEADKKKQDETRRLLQKAEVENSSLGKLAKDLRENKTGTTPIPKDIKDAWSKL